MNHKKTLKEIIDAIYNNEGTGYNFSHYIGDFLDFFYQEQRTEADRLLLIEDEPIEYENIPKWQYSYIAAMVHSLCLKYNLNWPIWALNKKYVLSEPYFAMDAKGDLRLILILESPYPFRARNMFAESNTLSRA